MAERRLHLAFVDLAMHKNTGSTAFLMEVFRERFDLSVVWVNSRNDFNQKIRCGELKDYDVIICLQVTPSNSMARQLRKPFVYVPMYDAESYNTIRWFRNKLQGGKVLCFSEKEARYLDKIGIETLKVKYYGPVQNIESGSPNKAFLWFRGGRYDLLKLVQSLLAKLPIDNLSIRCSTADLKRIPDAIKENKKIAVKCIDYASDPDEYKKLFKDCGIFVAPRLKEGIGMAFLEAMAMGKCVVANNDSTMNEYIQDKVNGFLIDFANPATVEIRNDERAINLIQKVAFDSAKQGRMIWENRERQRILDFTSLSYVSYRPMNVFEKFMWWLLLPAHFVADVATYLKRPFQSVKNNLRGYFPKA